MNNFNNIQNEIDLKLFAIDLAYNDILEHVNFNNFEYIQTKYQPFKFLYGSLKKLNSYKSQWNSLTEAEQINSGIDFPTIIKQLILQIATNSFRELFNNNKKNEYELKIQEISSNIYDCLKTKHYYLLPNYMNATDMYDTIIKDYEKYKQENKMNSDSFVYEIKELVIYLMCFMAAQYVFRQSRT